MMTESLSSRDEAMIRALVVGCPRSGTTLLQALLCSHRQLACISETHVFTRLFTGSRRHRIGLASAEVSEYVRYLATQLGHPEAASHLPSLSLRKVVKAFVQAADAHARDQHCLGWLEKTPEHVHHLGRIERAVRNVRAIHIVRRGRDVVASLYDVTRKHPDSWGGRPFTVEECIFEWIEAVAKTVAAEGRPNHVIVDYQSLTSAQSEIVQGLWRFLELPEEDVSAEALRASRGSVVPPNAPWQEVHAQVSPRSGTKFERVFDEAEQAKILERLHQEVGSHRLTLHGRPVSV